MDGQFCVRRGGGGCPRIGCMVRARPHDSRLTIIVLSNVWIFLQILSKVVTRCASRASGRPSSLLSWLPNISKREASFSSQEPKPLLAPPPVSLSCGTRSFDKVLKIIYGLGVLSKTGFTLFEEGGHNVCSRCRCSKI